jgi:hypothetical protein
MSVDHWQYILNNHMFVGHPRANGTRRITASPHNISAAKNDIDTANIGAINWHRFHFFDQAQAEERRRLLIEDINTAKQLLAEGQQLEEAGDEAGAQTRYIRSGQMYRDILNELKLKSPVPIKNFKITAIAPPGTRREHFNFAVRRARETGGNAAAAAVIAASQAASAELSAATLARLPALQAAHAQLAHLNSMGANQKNLKVAQKEVNKAFRELYGSAYNRRAPMRAAYATAAPYVQRVTSFPFGPAGAGAGPADSLGPAGSLFLSGAPRRGGKKTRRVYRKKGTRR